jgi:hypothetical protein
VLYTVGTCSSVFADSVQECHAVLSAQQAETWTRAVREARFTAVQNQHRPQRRLTCILTTICLSLFCPLSSTMSWFNKRKDASVIPPVEAPAPSYRSPAPSYRSTTSTSALPPVRSAAATYVASRDGPMYNKPSPSSQPPATDSEVLMDKYQRNKSVGDLYSRGQGNVDEDRSELFAGFKPKGDGPSGRFTDGPGLGREPPPGEENDEDIEGIKQQTRFLKQDSVNSTRNALRLAREAEETARSTMGRLGDQSGALSIPR